MLATLPLSPCLEPRHAAMLDTVATHLLVTHATRRSRLPEAVPSSDLRIVRSTPTADPAARRMDPAAYTHAVKAHSDALLRFVAKHLRDRDEAKDIVQESFLRLWTRLDAVTVTGARSYLFSTAHRLIVDRTRRRKYLDRYEDRHEAVLTVQQPKAGLRGALDAALARLSERQRALVLLRDRDGHSYADIATLTGLDVDRVKVYLFRARQAMRSQLGGLEQWV